jgi:hypothetical protein
MSTLPSCLKRLLENTLIRGGVPDSHVLVPVGRAIVCVCVCVCVCVFIYIYIYIYIQICVSVSVYARVLHGEMCTCVGQFTRRVALKGMCSLTRICSLLDCVLLQHSRNGIVAVLR